MPELTPQPADQQLMNRQRRRPSTRRTMVVLLLVFVFCVSAMAAGGAFDSSPDLSEASTRILTPEEAVRQAEQDAAAGDLRSGPVALIAALLLAAGGLLVSLAVPTRAERRRATAAPVAPQPAPDQWRPTVQPDSPTTVLPVLRYGASGSRFGTACPAVLMAVAAPAQAVVPTREVEPRRVGAKKPGTARNMAVARST